MSAKRIFQRSELRNAILFGAVVGVSLALSFVLGYFTRDLIAPSAFLQNPAGEGYPLLDEVQTLLDQHYLREQPSYAQRQHEAVRGLLNALGDRYTFFIDPPVAQSESDVLAGTYGGIGVQIQRAETGELVMFPFAESPAIEAGIADGDILLAINETLITFEIRQDVVDQMLRGEVRRGSGATITYRRPPDDEEITAFVPFGVINVPSVVWRVLSDNQRIGYVQIMRFTSRTPDELTTALTELNDSQIEALVVDMRGNNGGLLQESVAVGDIFLDGGVIVYEQDGDGERTFEAEAGSLVGNLPMVVLVNGGTASAAELVAGALQDRQRALLIGQRTFGKGTVQQIFRLSDESSIHITSAEWFTPNRTPLDGQGLTPDIEMIPDVNGRDVELGEAIRNLEAQLPILETAKL
ncbi:MAG: S41 family peptidase [Phototrophicaceae bacterium]